LSVAEATRPANPAAAMLGLPSLSQLDGDHGSPTKLRIWLCTGPTDMRKGFDTLAALAEQVTGQDPLSGHLFVFRNRRNDKLKLLMWDRDGYVLIYKRLEQGQFKLPGINEPPASAVRRGTTRPVGIRAKPYQNPICGLSAKNFSTS